MPVDKSYRMKLLESQRVLKTERRPTRVRKVPVKPATRDIVRAFKQVQGYEEIVDRIPKAKTISGWEKGTEVAYFSVCNKTGAARYLDIWDCEHFDGFTDMQRCIDDCRAWFSHTGFTTWGAPQTATGRINCYFNAAVAGDYSCVAKLLSYPASSQATVECLIDNNSFGPLPFTGTVVQPHFCVLSAGGHHFRIRQLSGAFFFLSLTVYHF
jgi:hypothetical protein